MEGAGPKKKTEKISVGGKITDKSMKKSSSPKIQKPSINNDSPKEKVEKTKKQAKKGETSVIKKGSNIKKKDPKKISDTSEDIPKPKRSISTLEEPEEPAPKLEAKKKSVKLTK